MGSGVCHIRLQPEETDITGEDTGNIQRKKAQADVEVSAFVSFHQAAADLHGFYGSHLGIIQKQIVGQSEEQGQDKTYQRYDHGTAQRVSQRGHAAGAVA